MIKGINRQIIDVFDPSGKYFERALLFVKPEFTEENDFKTCEIPDDKKLSAEANRILSLYNSRKDPKPKAKKKKLKIRRFIFALFWTAVGVGITEFFQLVLL